MRLEKRLRFSYVQLFMALIISACNSQGILDELTTEKEKEYEHTYVVTSDAASIDLHGSGMITTMGEEGEVIINDENTHQSHANYDLKKLPSNAAIVSLKSKGMIFRSGLNIGVTPRTQKKMIHEGIPGLMEPIYEDEDIPVTFIKVKFTEKINGKINREKELTVDPNNINGISFTSSSI